MARSIKCMLFIVATGLATAGAARAEMTHEQLEALAAHMAAELAAICPSAPRDDQAAYQKCSPALRDVSDLPFSSEGISWGGDQPNLRLSKMQLTHFRADLFRFLYLSLFSFTGRWSVGHDDRDKIDFIRIEGYFRNGLPAGEYSYPFWHRADKWTSWETANEVKFYLDHAGRIIAATRSSSGSEAARGPYAHVITPAFDGKWQWTDASGQTQPKVSLFSNRYSANNPFLEQLNIAYRDFGMQIREGTCLECHTPANSVAMDRLVLLQTPLHAAAELDNALKEVRGGSMPQDDLGLRKDIDPKLRAAILQTGEEFRRVLNQADQWETAQRHP